MLDTLRWASEMRPTDELNIPAAGRAATKLKDTELKMAGQLVKDMTQKWKPEAYADKFTDAIHVLIARKVKAGKTEKVEPIEEAPEGMGASNVVDLAVLLKNSLGLRKGPAGPAAKGARKAPATKAVAKAVVAKKTAATRLTRSATR
jgi:DNA end-binding protein Ku